jgi:hypothetical protein
MVVDVCTSAAQTALKKESRRIPTGGFHQRRAL